MSHPKFLYAGYPTAKVFKNKGDSSNIHELLWGDWVRITGNKSGGFWPVKARGVEGFMKVEDLQEERLLEIVFVDVGQGDGALVITPDDKHMVIDAGQFDNMYRFLKWRYGGFKNKWTFDAGIMTHPDQDHYFGFDEFFDDPNVHFKTMYHNGIIETGKSGKATELGESKAIDGEFYITELMETHTAMRNFLLDKPRWTTSRGGLKRYPRMLNKARLNNSVDKFEMLSTFHSDGGFVPGYGADKDLSMEVLGPVVESDDGQRSLLRWFKRFGKGSHNKGQTKNGHSIMLKLKYKDMSVLLTGDLNWASERFLLEQHLEREIPADDATDEEKALFVGLAREVFATDIVKCCHHGAADFMNTFLDSCHNTATVVSSGDAESHAHPRSDTLGAIGKFGRGVRPLIFSTELARSTRENESPAEVASLKKKQEALANETDPQKKAALLKDIKALTKEIAKRNVTVYGAINLRSNGEKVVMAQKLEKDRNSGGRLQKWDVYKLEPDASGELSLVSSGGH